MSYLAGSKSVSVCPSVRSGYNNKYRSRGYRFAERQKRKSCYDEEMHRNWVKNRLLWTTLNTSRTFLPLDEAKASRAIMVIVSGLTDGHAFGAS